MIEKNCFVKLDIQLSCDFDLFPEFLPPIGASFDLSDKELLCVEEQDVFDRVYSLIRGYSALTPSCKSNLVESLRSNLSVLLPSVDSVSRLSQGQDGDSQVLDRIGSHRNAFKIYTFFLFSVIFAEESTVSTNHNSKVPTFSYLSLRRFICLYVLWFKYNISTFVFSV